MLTPPPAPAPDSIEELAVACVRYVHQALDLTLDFTPETLPIVDHYVRNVPRQADDAVLALIAPAVGAYFGEVLRRTYVAVHWHCPAHDYAGYRLEFERHFLAFNPLGMALEAVLQKEVPGWHAHFALLDEDREAVRTSLERTDDVRAEDYYSLSVRFEVIEQILGVLASRAAARGDVNRHFGRAVYRAAGLDGD